MLAVGEGHRTQVVGLSRAGRGRLPPIVVAVDVRVLGRGIEGRGFVGVGAAFAKARRLLDGAEGALDGLELLLASLPGVLAVRYRN